LAPLAGDAQALQSTLEACASSLERQQVRMLHDKLGLAADGAEDGLVDDLPAILQRCETDMTIFFRRLADLETTADALAHASDERLLAPLMDAYYAPAQLGAAERAAIAAWLRRYTARVLREAVVPDLRRARMQAVNPKYVLRNYLAQLAIDQAERGDTSMLHALLDVLRLPYAEQPVHEAWAAKRPEWARHRPGCSMLSCSS
jgi:uncharacterized protein YdiU (UPF0061 family)